MFTTTRMRGLDLQRALEARAAALPPLSSSVVELTTVCVRDDWDIDEACAVIDTDPMLLGVLLREANSAVFAAASMVDSSRDAVVRLGAARIMSVAVEMGLERLLGDVQEYGAEAMEVVRHSFVASVAAEVVKLRTRLALPQALAAAAVLHDVGEIVLAHHLDHDGGASLAEIRAQSLTAVDAEREQLGLDHCDVSAIVCRQWRVPEAVVRTLAVHHTPWSLGEPIAYAVSLADQIAEAVADPDRTEAIGGSLVVGRCLDQLELHHTSLADLVTDTRTRLERSGRR